MKKQNKMTTIAAGIAMVVLTATSLATATFAWFTRGTEAQATGFEFTASAATGIQISTNAIDWRSSITAAEIAGSALGQTGSRVTLPGTMEPTSTNASATAGALSFFGATLNESTYTTVADTDNFIVFNLYFNNTGTDDLTLKLSSDSSVVAGTLDKGTQNSTRVAFLNQGASDQAGAAALAGATGTGSVYVWEPNSTVRSSVAENLLAQDDAKYTYQGVYAADAVTANHYGKISNQAGVTQAVTTHDIALGESNEITVLPAASITKMTVYIWIEGQDIDNDNSAASGDVEIDLSFDSSAADGSNAVNALTATALTTAGALTTSGTPFAGASYTAYIFTNGTDANAGATYKVLVASGAVSSSIPVAAGSYQVVIFGDFLGAKSVITGPTAITVS